MMLIGEDEDFNCQKEQAPYSNYLSFNIKNNPPAWAKTYKLFIKENNKLEKSKINVKNLYLIICY